MTQPTTLIIYVAGVSRTGFAGYGYHGYLHDSTPPKRGTGNPNVLPTQRGYASKEDMKIIAAGEPAGIIAMPDGSNVEVPLKVAPLKYIDGYSTIEMRCTANAAAMIGLTQLMKNLCEPGLIEPVQRVMLTVGNKYVFNNLSDALNSLRRPDQSGKPWRCADQFASGWDKLYAQAKELVNKGVSLAAQAGNGMGIDTATELATMSAFGAVKGAPLQSIRSTDPQSYWNPKTEIHPLLTMKKMFFGTQPCQNTRGMYFMGTNRMPDEYEGKRSHDTAYSIALLKEPVPVLEEIRDYHARLSVFKNLNALTESSYDALVMAMLPKVFKSSIYESLLAYGSDSLASESIYRQDLTHASGEQVTREFRPMGLALRAIEQINTLYNTLAEFNAGNGKRQTITEVTDCLFDKVIVKKAGKETTAVALKKDFGSDATTLSVNVGFQHPGQEVSSARIELVFGLDIPDRNPMNRLAAMSPRVFVITQTPSDNSFTYCTIIETANGDTAIWAAPFTNSRLVIKPIQ